MGKGVKVIYFFISIIKIVHFIKKFKILKIILKIKIKLRNVLFIFNKYNLFIIIFY